MKKIIIILFAIAILLTSFSLSDNTSVKALEPDKRYETVIMTLLMPEVDKAITDFYAPYLNNRPITAAYYRTSKITKLVGNENDTLYTVEMEVSPHIGPHLHIGIDRITFEIDAIGNVTVKDFKHIKTYQLPPHYLDDIIMPLPVPNDTI